VVGSSAHVITKKWPAVYKPGGGGFKRGQNNITHLPVSSCCLTDSAVFSVFLSLSIFLVSEFHSRASIQGKRVGFVTFGIRG
jgi:hypothetical protein